jgi:thiamine-monophosphate kinase
MKDSQQISDIGESGLLQLLHRFCPAEIVGDDAAIVEVPAGKSLAVTTDVLVDGVHFSQQTTAPEDVGWRAAAANLSDLAAMGAIPLGITVGLSLPANVPVSWVESLYQGLAACLQPYQTPILGGDVCRSPVTTVGITALGYVSPQRTIRRCLAQPEQAIVATGYHGCSRAGLELLLKPEFGQNLATEAREMLILAHQRPKPRLDVLEPLWRIIGDRSVAGMDSSDGLADAVVQLCRFSGTGAILERQSIPIAPALRQLVSPEQALAWALYGGEDFELVLCLPPEAARTLISHLGEGAAIIGQVTAGNAVEIIDREGIEAKRLLTLAGGFQHF